MNEMEQIALIQQSIEYFPLSGVFLWKTKRPDNHFLTNRARSTWHSRYAGKNAGCINNIGYLDITISYQGKRFRFLGHRVAYALMLGRYPSEDVDHKNGSRSDNRWENLREASRTVNQRNKAMTSANTSGYTGVSFSKVMNAWHAYINISKNKRKNIGYFSTKEEASKARTDFIKNHPDIGYTQRHGAYHRDVWRETYALEF